MPIFEICYFDLNFVPTSLTTFLCTSYIIRFRAQGRMTEEVKQRLRVRWGDAVMWPTLLSAWPWPCWQLKSSWWLSSHFSFHPPSAPFFSPFSIFSPGKLMQFVFKFYTLSWSSNHLVITWAAMVENPTRPLQLALDTLHGASLVARAEQCFALLPNLHLPSLHSPHFSIHVLFMYAHSFCHGLLVTCYIDDRLTKFIEYNSFMQGISYNKIHFHI